jgi:hypothetical protein
LVVERREGIPPAFGPEVPAAVVLDETVVTVQPNGWESSRHRVALRILNRSGREMAVGAVSYLDKEDRVETATAWLIRAGKEIRPSEKHEWVDLSAADGGEVFSEHRKRAIAFRDLALEGDVFGYETSVASRMLFAQEQAIWDGALPVVKDVFSLRLPPSWTLQAVVDGPMAASLRTTNGPETWTWELSDYPYRPDEPSMTDMAQVGARLMITFGPSPGTKGEAPPQFRSWTEVAHWKSQFYDGQCDTNPALLASVRQLTAGCPDALGRMRALSQYVQRLRYVSADKGLKKGFGYRPRKATEVHAKGWGDCKDKANLLRAMLKEVGIDSFMVSAQTEGGRALNDDWPSPAQFNHAILAIRVDESVAFPTVVNTPKFGRLLFFDPTDDDVCLGDLPWHLQGAKCFIVGPGSDALTTLPVLPTETRHVVDRRVQLQLDASGAVAGECSYGGPGRVGSIYRERIRTMSAKDLRTDITERINTTVRGARLDDFTTSDDLATGECRFKFRFAAPRFAQMMAGGLAVVRLDVLSRDAVPTFSETTRRLAVGLSPILQRDEVTLVPPPGYVAEELPDKALLQSPYGSYESAYTVGEGTVVVRRTLRLEDRTVPVAEYAALRKFLQDVAKADHASVILRRAELPGGG